MATKWVKTRHIRHAQYLRTCTWRWFCRVWGKTKTFNSFDVTRKPHIQIYETWKFIFNQSKSWSATHGTFYFRVRDIEDLIYSSLLCASHVQSIKLKLVLTS